MAGREQRPKILIICAHLHEDRSDKRNKDDLQPLAGLHLASLIDRERYEVALYHELWHGPYPTARVRPDEHALVVLTGLQMDFDRMRQLSYFFRRSGSKVVAGGSICTLFPEFATEFFDAVCAGGVECILDVMRDLESGTLKPVYRSPQSNIGNVVLDYSILDRSGIRLPVHYVEASRGCNFRCGFCSIPAERARHAIYTVDNVVANVDASIDASPGGSFRRLFPVVWFIDNNFSNNLGHVRVICEKLKAHGKVKAWGALVTQDLLANRDLVRLMAQAGCAKVFAGIESFDVAFNERVGKVQNLKNSHTLEDDIAYAESLGIMVLYGILFDPQVMSVETMTMQVRTVLQSPLLHFPYFFAFVAPLVGTRLFWQSVDERKLLPNLRLRDLDGRCVCYADTVDDEASLSAFARTIFAAPKAHVNVPRLAADVLRRVLTRGWRQPFRTYLYWENRARLWRLGRQHRRAAERNYIGGREILDRQYAEYPADIAPEDRRRYFDPVLVTDENGEAASWLAPYRPASQRRLEAQA